MAAAITEYRWALPEMPGWWYRHVQRHLQLSQAFGICIE